MPSKRTSIATEEMDYESYDSESDESDDEQMYANQVAVGSEADYSADIVDILNYAAENNQDFVCMPLFHPDYRSDAAYVSHKTQRQMCRSDMALDDQDWTSNVTGMFSKWIDLESADDSVRMLSEAALKREYLYGVHLGLQAMILDAPSRHCPNYSRNLLSLLKSTPPTAAQIWVRIPFIDGDGTDGWLIWDTLRHAIGHHPRVFIALEAAHDLKDSSQYLARWSAEPIKAVVLTTDCFRLSKQGTKPILGSKYCALLHSLFKFRIHVIIRGDTHPALTLGEYTKCIEKLCAMGPDGAGQGPFTLYDKFSFPFRDNLQCPLHPLSDNLDSETYRVMEQDPVKYSQYELAVKRALIDLSGWNGSSPDTKTEVEQVKKKSKKQKSSDASSSSSSATGSVEPLVVMVVGAGRGPLVQATLNASEETGIPVKIYAVEKNFNAVVTLRNRFDEPTVTVLSTDMRELPLVLSRLGITLQVDIIVSELLGSWGDNELSPECLDTVQHYLHPERGVMIPQNYESYMAPMAGAKLWMSAKDMFHTSDSRSGLDTPYVVNFHSVYVPNQAKPLFKFVHPNPQVGQVADHNKRFGTLSFQMTESMTVHGFAGYFDCVLYKDVTFSTVPHTHSPGMFSWFPLFVPLRVPLRVNAGDDVTVSVWRVGDRDRVWYEWGLSQPLSTGIQNSNGVSYCVKL